MEEDPVIQFVAECSTHMDALLQKWYPQTPRLEPRLLQPEARFDRHPDVSVWIVVLVGVICVAVGIGVSWALCGVR